VEEVFGLLGFLRMAKAIVNGATWNLSSILMGTLRLCLDFAAKIPLRQQAFGGSIYTGERKEGQNSGDRVGDSEALVDNARNFRITVVNRAYFLGR
jgi:hypothetical protein